MPKKKLKPSFKEQDLGRNPLVDKNFTINARTIKRVKRVVELESIRKDEEIVTYGEPANYETIYTVESENFTKVFTKAAYRLYIMNLPSRARDLYLWLIYELDPGKDYLWINEERVRLELNVSYNTLKGAMQDLIKDVVIVESAIKGVYWINPLFFFNGSRLDKYKDFITIKND
jgi:hypothetical protein